MQTVQDMRIHYRSPVNGLKLWLIEITEINQEGKTYENASSND